MLPVSICLLVILIHTCFAGPENFKDIRFVLFSGLGTYDIFPINTFPDMLLNSNYDRNRKTVFFLHGYTENFTTPSSQLIAKAFLTRNDYNVVVFDWSEYSRGNYVFEAVSNAYKVGELFGKVLLNMNELGIKLEDFYIVGHSLGSQVAGITGRSIIKNSKGRLKLTRITGLDPAGPGFYGITAGFNRPISKNDALFVDIIHTDSTYFGAPQATGTVDFWPNGGKNQPGCPPGSWNIFKDENFCSHNRAFELYAESVKSTSSDTFASIHCASWTAFNGNKCTSSVMRYMGINAVPGISGNYFLQTNSMDPLSRGVKGTIYQK